jgi:hypothetical protein
MADPLDAHGDALRRALHAEADAVVPAPDALDRVRARRARAGLLGHNPAVDLVAVLALALILLFTLGGS